MGISPASGALGVLAAGLQDARARQDADARSIAADPFDVAAVVDLSTADLGMRAMAAALRTVADTQGALIDLLA